MLMLLFLLPQMLLEKSNQEKESLKIEWQELQKEAMTKREELNGERSKSRLLMEYPFSPRVDTTMTLSQSREHIDANSARIFYLEEQNQEIRQLYTPRGTNLQPLNVSHKYQCNCNMKLQCIFFLFQISFQNLQDYGITFQISILILPFRMRPIPIK